MSRVTDDLQGGQPDRRRSPRRGFEVSAARILDSITDEVIGVDRKGRVTYVNEAALQSIRLATGRELTRQDVLGKNVWDMLPVPVGSHIYQAYHDAAREQKTVNFEARSPSTDGCTERTIYPSEEGLTIYCRDITDRKRLEHRMAYDAYLLEHVHDAVIATSSVGRRTST